ncbi:MAG: hypothetical protein AMS18_14445 [Gemmatimonas sp. SG8_17]|nr:MAG: hypothetical protein AMS18_14445 [Gemmatimonas sp. SG8_17]
MHEHPFSSRRWLATVVVAVVLATACTKDDIVFRDVEPFNSPPDAASGFLGYYLTVEKQTTCGNCHADKQAEWAETAHADAWAGLQSSDFAAESCEGCHTVNELGNALAEPAGFKLVADSAYHDVQCESCHGPGVNHVSDPTFTRPLASIAVGEAATNGCGECHSDAHHPFVEQWAESRHGNTTSFAKGRSPCNECHEGTKALESQFGVSADYLEKGTGVLLDITCAVCHDPHGGPNPGQLRAPISVATKNNLCIKCHSTTTVPTATTHGPHGAQGPLVLGENIGWWAPGFEWLDGLTGAHGDPAVNPGLCATCHVASFAVTQPEFFQSVGHSFEAIPCLDANGIPEPGPCTNDERTFSACASCHGTEANSQAVYEAFTDELNVLLGQIWFDSNGDDHLDAAPTDAGVLAQIVAAVGPKELDVSDTLFTFAEGVLWNAQLAATDDTPHFREAFIVVAANDTVEFGAHPTSGNGVHNPPFLEALLKASITAAADHYGIVLPAGVDLTIAAQPLQGTRD